VDLTVLIGTCDAYRVLWKNFSICFNKFWPHLTHNVVVGETQEMPLYTSTFFTTLLCGDGVSWAQRMRQGAELAHDHIFFILEDYFLCYQYTKEQLNQYMSDMDKYNIDRLQIGPSDFQMYKEDPLVPYQRLDSTSNYLICMQPSIWRKDFLLQALDPSYSPWEFELKGTKAVQASLPRIYYDSSLPFTSRPGDNLYFNAVRKGFQKSEGWEDFREAHNLEDF